MYDGAVTPHGGTSFFPLVIVMVVVSFLVTFYTSYAVVNPQDGSIALTGIVPGKPPQDAPVITSPTNGQHFPTTPITIKGTCPEGTLVELFKNDIFAGSVFCDNGNFSLDIDLLYGKNDLMAQGYDPLGQASPSSGIVTVFYDALPPSLPGQTGLDFGKAQLLINTDAVYRGVFPGKEMAIQLSVLGGRTPYAVNIIWGDGEHSLVPRNDSAVFYVPHIYKKPGIYPISIQATDADGRVAFIKVAAVVNGTPDPATPTASSSTTPQNPLLLLWPLYAAIIGIIIAFFLGERREKHVLAKHHQLISQV
jgi:hypothetical protein